VASGGKQIEVGNGNRIKLCRLRPLALRWTQARSCISRTLSEQAGKSPITQALNVLWRAKFWILAAIIIGGGLGTAPGGLNRPNLQVRSRLWKSWGLTRASWGWPRLDPQTNTNPTTPGSMQTQIRILTSGSLLNRTAQRVRLELPAITRNPPGHFQPHKKPAGNSFGRNRRNSRGQAITMAARSADARGIGSTRLV